MGSVCGTDQYNSLEDEEFKLSDDDIKWLLAHTEYDEKELNQLLAGFRSEYPGGGIYRHQFEQLVGNTVMEVVFNCLDTDNNGYLDFKEFNQALQLLSSKTTEQKLQWAFRLYDEDNSGLIDKDEMANIMMSLYKMLEGMGQRPSGDPKLRARDIFAEIDVNSDGTLTEEEFIKGCQLDDELIALLTKLFETLLEVRVNLHGVLTKLKLKYCKK